MTTSVFNLYAHCLGAYNAFTQSQSNNNRYETQPECPEVTKETLVNLSTKDRLLKKELNPECLDHASHTKKKFV